MRRAGRAGGRPWSLLVATALAATAAGCGWGPAESGAVDDAIVVGDEVVRADVLANDRIADGDEVAALRLPEQVAGVRVDGLVLLVGPFGALERTSFEYEFETVAGDRASATVRVEEGVRAAPPVDPVDDPPPPVEPAPPPDRPSDEPPPAIELPDLVVELAQLGPAPDDAVEYRAVVSNVGPGDSTPVRMSVAAGGAVDVLEIPGLGSGEVHGLGGVLDTDPTPGIELVAEVDVQGAAIEADEGNNFAAVPIDYVPRGTLEHHPVLVVVPGPGGEPPSKYAPDWLYRFVLDADDPDGGPVTVAWASAGGGSNLQETQDDGSILVSGSDPTCGDLLVVSAELTDDEGTRATVTTTLEIETCEPETAPIL